MRAPVASLTALVKAGAAQGKPGSPVPPGGFVPPGGMSHGPPLEGGGGEDFARPMSWGARNR